MAQLPHNPSPARPTGATLIVAVAVAYLVVFAWTAAVVPEQLSVARTAGSLARLGLLWLIYQGRSLARVVETLLDVGMCLLVYLIFEEARVKLGDGLVAAVLLYYGGAPLVLWFPPVSRWMAERRRLRQAGAPSTLPERASAMGGAHEE